MALTTIKGPAIFLAQFMGDAAPFDNQVVTAPPPQGQRGPDDSPHGAPPGPQVNGLSRVRTAIVRR